jgi:translation initiation factor 5B
VLDNIRKTTIALKEPGAITQSIGASFVPREVLMKICSEVGALMKLELKIPGLLFIDTPGHESFTNLRKRGGSIADLAVLIVDVTQGFQPQTIESIEILKEYKTPFVVAANKIDLIQGWKSSEGCFIKNISQQRSEVQQELDRRIYDIIGELSKFGINADRFDRVDDFSKTVAIVPISAKKGEGIPDLIVLLAGLAQKFMEKQLETEIGPGKGSILEVKFEKGLGTTADVILYDGKISKGDIVVFGTKDGAASTRVRGLLKPKPLVEMRDTGDRFEYVDEVVAASGIKIFAPGLENALPGSEIYVAKNEDEEVVLKNKLSAEISETMIKTEKEGIILRADTLGSLEAITRLIQHENIPIRRADVGPVVKGDVIEAVAIREVDRYLGAILAFNVNVPLEVLEEAKSKGVPIINTNIIYSLLDQFKAWREEEKKREAEEALASYVFPAKVKILPGCCFRASKPAVFGVEVIIGRIKPDYELMKEDGTSIGCIKSIQQEKQSLSEARAGQQVAIAVDEPIFGRHIFENDILYSVVPKKHIAILREKYRLQLNDAELNLLDEIEEIIRKV